MVLPYLINSDQSGFMKGKCISDNIMQLQNVIDCCEKEKIQAIIMSVDFEKAFDKVQWDSMFRILQAFNFGLKFIDLVKLLQ